MKIITIVSILIFSPLIYSYGQLQTIEMTFTAENNDQYVPIDSILIENLTQGGDTTLYAPDTVLVLGYITSMDDNRAFTNNTFSLSQNYPNPMKGKTSIGLYLPERENILITVSDIMGRELINVEYKLDQGSHSFIFYPGRKRMYFLTARLKHQSHSIKMFNTPGYANGSGSFKLEYNGQHSGFDKYKSGNDLNNFVFDLGDQLKFTSFTYLGERVITDSPTGDQTYYFHYTSQPCPGMPTVTDIDGNVYNTVQIGTQCWMKENLKTTTYNNGTSIPNVADASLWSDLTSGAYVWCNNDISWKESYGALYNWYATVDPNGLCPSGWHVLTNNEWTVLTDYIEGTGFPHGNELKSCRQVDSPLVGCNTNVHPRWNSNSGNWGTDDYGFSGLPGGYRFFNGSFNTIGSNGYWWSSTETSSYDAWYYVLSYTFGYVYEGAASKQLGCSVRCLMD